MTLSPANSHGVITSVTRVLTPAETGDLGSTAIELVAAPGATRVLTPIGGVASLSSSTQTFAANAALSVLVGNVEALTSSALDFNSTDANGGFMAPGTERGFIADEAMTLEAAGIIGLTGSLLTATVNAGGLLYAPGDTGTVNHPGADATYTVATVGAGGAVTAVTITPGAGVGYVVGTTYTTTATTGTGDGNLTLDAATITPLSDATLAVTVYYAVAPA